MPNRPITGARTVVLVEDDQPVLELLAGVLRSQGYPVAEASDGAAAIRLIDEHCRAGDLGLVVLDMRLPDVSGLGVMRHVAACGVAVPVVAISGKPHLLYAAMAGGAQAAVEKPVDIGQLLEMVARNCQPGPARGSGAAPPSDSQA